MAELLKVIPIDIEIPESAQEIPSTNIAGPSRKLPSNLNGFYFEVEPTRLLKLALEALCDPEFNPSGIGRIDVGESFFKITVHNPDNVFGSLCLFGTQVKNFQCNKPMVGKLVNLRQISENLVASNDEDTLSVLHEHGSNKISFTFGKEPGRGFAAEFLKNRVEIPEFPNVETICHAIIDTFDMRHLIEELVKKGRPSIVLVDMTKKTAKIMVGQEREEHNSETMGVTVTMVRAEGGEKHHSWFSWTYPEVLRKALLLFSAFVLSFVRNPPTTMMMCFKLQELGQLMFLKKADELTTNIDSFVPFPNWM